MKTEYMAFISYGKDSLAMLEAISLLKLPLDKIISVDIWPTSTIRGEHPETLKFRDNADKFIKNRYNIDVTHIKADITYEEQFYKLRNHYATNSKKIYGFPIVKGAWCNSRLKMKPINDLIKNKNVIQYLGIASDELLRIYRHTNPNIVLPLVEIGWSEKDCFEFCEKHNILSPVYYSSFRDGCWFCHNQGIEQLRLLRKNYPDLWKLMLKWDNDSPVCFKPDGHTLHDFDKRFKLEDLGIVPKDRTFRWKMIEKR